MKATIALPEVDLGYLPALLAQSSRSFEKQGLEVELVAMRGAQEGIDALLKGNVDFVMSIGPALPAIWEGNKLKVLVQMANRHCFHLVAQKEIKRLDGLSKQKIAVGLGGMTFIFACEVAAQSQIKEGLYVNIPGSAAKLAALKAGAVTAAVLPSPFHFQALKTGLKDLSLGGINEELTNVPFTGLVTKESYILKNEDTVSRMVAAIVSAAQDVSAYPDAVESVLQRYFAIRQRRDAANIYKAIKSSFDPNLTEAGVRRLAGIVGKYMGKEPKIDPGYDYTDLRFLQNALQGSS